MSSSKIIRNCDEFECRPLAMSELAEVVESQAGSFVEIDNVAITGFDRVATSEAPGAEIDGVSPADISRSAQSQQCPDADANADALHAAYEKGRQEGIAQAEAQLGQATQSLASACNEIADLREKILQSSSDDMLRLVLAIAERVIQVELSINKEIIARTVQQAIQAAVSSEEFRIKVNPDDMQVVQENKPLFIASLSGLSNIEFVADSSITRGGCILESPLGRVDATIEAQLQAITYTLEQSLGAGES